jgi:hypothetical protein
MSDTRAWAMLNLMSPPISLLTAAVGKAANILSLIFSMRSKLRWGAFLSN